MDTAIISAVSAVLGSLVGGSTSFATAWINQSYQSKRTMLLDQIGRKETLYGEFINECSKLAIDAMDHSLEDPAKLFEVYALQNRIRLISSDAVVAASEKTIKDILFQYYLPNVNFKNIREVAMKNEPEAIAPKDPLRQFSESCRLELSTLRSEA